VPGAATAGGSLRGVRRRPVLLLAFLAAYLLSYFYRSTNAVLAGDLQRDAGIGTEELGLMTSLFFATFALAQLPLGAALDRFGPRWVPAGLMLAAVAGSFITAAAEGFVGLALGRALIGLGMAGVLMGALKAFAAWFEPQRFALISSLFVAAGSLGALGATTPLTSLADTLGWRGVFVAVGILTAAIAALLMVVVRAAPPGGGAASAPAGGAPAPPVSAPSSAAPPSTAWRSWSLASPAASSRCRACGGDRSWTEAWGSGWARPRSSFSCSGSR
jgi:MFS family permease